ncbi:MAG: hypothetical protein LBH45_00575 [Campylobacteraceae bacterium]|nr:hypothetical protein [Campylobacteraceae bacterium]
MVFCLFLTKPYRRQISKTQFYRYLPSNCHIYHICQHSSFFLQKMCQKGLVFENWLYLKYHYLQPIR